MFLCACPSIYCELHSRRQRLWSQPAFFISRINQQIKVEDLCGCVCVCVMSQSHISAWMCLFSPDRASRSLFMHAPFRFFLPSLNMRVFSPSCHVVSSLHLCQNPRPRPIPLPERGKSVVLLLRMKSIPKCVRFQAGIRIARGGKRRLQWCFIPGRVT